MDRLYPSDDFDAIIRIYSPEEGGRNHPTYNGVKWDFSYADPIREVGDWCIWPDFYVVGGDSRPKDVPLPVGVETSARMFIMADEMREIHRHHIRPGVRFYCIEGPHRVAEGEVTKVTGLFEPRTDPKQIARGSPRPIGSNTGVATVRPPTDPEILDPYRRQKYLAYIVISLGLLIGSRRLFPNACVSMIVIALCLVVTPILLYLMVREHRDVKARLRRLRGLPGHCIHCGWYEQDKKRKRCSQCLKLLDA